jgi:hypothetical protein
MDNNAPTLRRYVAEAVQVPFASQSPSPPLASWNARFGFPGGVVDFVREGDAPAVYHDQETAENEARRVLVESLNSRMRFSDKREISSKMSGDEFAAELGETGIGPGDFAQMWGTKQGKVMDWITGAGEVPFALRWILPLLRRAGAIEEAQKIVAENISYKPDWIERQRVRAENEEGTQ